MTTRTAFLLVALTLRLAWAQPADEGLELAAERALKLGDYAGAIQKATQAAALFEASGAHDRLGAAHNTIGAASLHSGDYPRALASFDRALLLAQETGDISSEVRRQNNIGSVHFFRGDYVQAFARFQAGLARLAGSESQPWYPQIRQLTLTNMAVLHQQLGQNQRALELYRELRSLPGKLEPNVEAQMLTNLAITYRRLGDPQKALENYRLARSLLAKDPNAAAALYTLHNVGVVLALDFGDYPHALDTFREALVVATKTGSKREMVLERLFLGQTLLLMKRHPEAAKEFTAALGESQALKLVDERWTALYGLGQVDAANGDTSAALGRYREAISVIESERSRLGRGSLKDEFLADKRDVYDAVIGLLIDQPDPPVAEILRRLEEGRSRNLKELLPAEGPAVDLESIQRNLGDRDMLIEYWVAGGRLAAVWIKRGSKGVIKRPLGKAGIAAIDALTASLANPRNNDWKRLAKEVSPILLDRMPLDAAQVSRLIVVPDGNLHALPFEILESRGGGPRLIEQFDLSYLPSAHFLARAKHDDRNKWPWQVVLSVFADPLTGDLAKDSPFEAPLARLTYSPQEARAAAGALPGSEQMFVGADNLKRHVFEPGVGQSRVLHFATHAAIDLNDSRRSRMVFTPEPGQAASQYLFWGEIAKLKLPAVELVTLAACESEQGRNIRGEGVQSFSRAFLAAGAASAVSSLWRVSDQATARLMASFYSHLASGATKAESLRQAKLEFVAAGGPTAHPYFWAAFVLTGDGNSPLSPVIRWWQMGAAGAVALLVLGGLLWRVLVAKR